MLATQKNTKFSNQNATKRINLLQQLISLHIGLNMC